MRTDRRRVRWGPAARVAVRAVAVAQRPVRRPEAVRAAAVAAGQEVDLGKNFFIPVYQ